MIVHSEFYNLGHGGSRNYLPKGHEELTHVFVWLALAYFALFFMWILLYNDEKRPTRLIHWWMYAVLLVKGFNLLCSAEKMHLLSASGTLPPSFALASRTFYYCMVYSIEALIVVALWKSKSVLHPKLRIVTLITLAAQIITNVGFFCTGDERSRSIRELNKWNTVFVLTNLAFFLPVVASAWWSIKSLKEAEEAGKKGAASKLSEMKKLLGIYIAGMGYLHFVYLFLFLLKGAANISKGTSTAVEEAANLALCAIMLYLFRPEAKDGFYPSVDDVERPPKEEDKDKGMATDLMAYAAK
ncbi:hypothetical protein MLD38_026493 [Melastoma candidum]|nr:hypothetical protein MLD38_026493 [Melastoma candidum]